MTNLISNNGQPQLFAYLKFDEETAKLIAAVMENIPASEDDGDTWSAIYLRLPGQLYVEGQTFDTMLAVTPWELCVLLHKAVGLNLQWRSASDPTVVAKNHHFNQASRKKIVEALQRCVWLVELTPRGLHLHRSAQKEDRQTHVVSLKAGSPVEIYITPLDENESAYLFDGQAWRELEISELSSAVAG